MQWPLLLTSDEQMVEASINEEMVEANTALVHSDIYVFPWKMYAIHEMINEFSTLFENDVFLLIIILLGHNNNPLQKNNSKNQKHFTS